MNKFEDSSHNNDNIGTERERFNFLLMCTDLTAECARRFLKALKNSGGNRLENHVEKFDGDYSTNLPDEHQF